MTAIGSISEDYLIAGISVIPVNQDKSPSVRWEPFKSRPIEVGEAHRLFDRAWGVAMVCGAVSGGLEVIDFDAHNHNIQHVFDEFMADDAVQFIMSSHMLPIERSPRGGFHVFYRYDAPKRDGSMKLANWEDGSSMIETRGEGSYIIVSPSPKYTMISGDLTDVPTITADQRDYMVQFARKFDLSKRGQDHPATPTGFDETDPISRFNWEGAGYAKNLLRDQGWRLIEVDKRTDIEYWQRPGKEERDTSTSATWGKKYNSLYVFSSSASPFRPECYYTPFQIVIKLKYNGRYHPALQWVTHKYSSVKTPYLRIGVDYFKRITKTDRFGFERLELKPWTKEEIRQDEGKDAVKDLPMFDDFTVKPDNFSYDPVVNNCYNLYREFIHKPHPGDWRWTNVLIEHIFGEQYEIGMRYLQILYLHPEHLMPILVLVSKARQTGKTTFLNWINMIFGDNVANIAPDDLVNGFNASYASANIITVEETLIEKAVTVEKIKALATQKFITVNQKFVSQYRMPFYGKIILTSNNEEKFARIDDEEIRFFIRKVGKPKFMNHAIENNLADEIPAFLHHLTTLPPVDFSRDRSGFTPEELNNTSLAAVKAESKSWLCKDLSILLESYFTKEGAAMDEVQADVKSIYDRFFSRNSRVEINYLRNVLKNEMGMELSDKPVYVRPFHEGEYRTLRVYTFKRSDYTDQPAQEGWTNGAPF